MKKNTIYESLQATHQAVYIGLDVHKKTIFLAATSQRTWLLEKVFDTQDLSKLKKALQKLAQLGCLRICYEASGAGFRLQRLLSEWGFHCEVIAPSLIPTKPGEKKKCDRLDARKLAEYFANGLLTSVRIPTPQEEADRDLIRCRFAYRRDSTKAKHRLVKFLARKGRVYHATAWTLEHRSWLSGHEFQNKADQLTHGHLLDDLRILEARLTTLDAEILELSGLDRYRDHVRVLRGFKGVDTLTAMVFLTELGDLKRFGNPRQLMAYLGMVPSVHQSGDTHRGGSITKAGNSYLRHVLVQASWNYFGPAKVGKLLAQRQKDLPPWVLEQSTNAQKRISKRLNHLSGTRGKCVAVVAGARELACFMAFAILTLDERKAKGLDLQQSMVAELNKGGRPPKASKLAQDSGSQRGARPSAMPALCPM